MTPQQPRLIDSRVSRRRFIGGAGATLGGVAGLLSFGCGDRGQIGHPRPRQASPAATWTAAPRNESASPVHPPEPTAPIEPQVSSAIWPLKVSEDGRYLTDQAGIPFLIRGEAAWSLIANTTTAEAARYLTDRAKRGFNAVLVNLLEARFAVNAPANRNGDQPFLTPGDFSTPNEAYFAFADDVLDLTAQHGNVVFLCYMYPGWGGGDQGFWDDLNSPVNTQDVCFEFGRYLGNRYKDRLNLVFVAGGDFTPPAGTEGEARLFRMLQGIKAAGARQLHTGHWSAPIISTDQARFAPAMDLNAVYTYGPGNNGLTYIEARRGFDHSPPTPAFLLETGYEAEGWSPGDPASIREYQYWAVLGGATAGFFYGHRDIWEFATGTWSSGFGFGSQHWEQSLNARGTLDSQRLGALLSSLNWYQFVPRGSDNSADPIVSGGGNWAEGDYVAAASGDGRSFLAYVPPGGSQKRTFKVDMASALGSAGRAQWFDPTDGSLRDIGPTPADNTVELTSPGSNASGANDWVLRIERTGPVSMGPHGGLWLPGVARDG